MLALCRLRLPLPPGTHTVVRLLLDTLDMLLSDRLLCDRPCLTWLPEKSPTKLR